MKWLFSLLLLSSVAAADLRVVVLDTGLDLEDPRFAPYLCPTGHKDFTGQGINDINGHGTHVVGDIIKNAGNTGYCLIILKYYVDAPSNNFYLQAFIHMPSLQPHFVNVSGGGPQSEELEKLTIELLKNTTFVVAAGNANKDLAIEPYYPAAYTFPNVITVGNGTDRKHKSKLSNYGKVVDVWEPGENIESTCPNMNLCKMSGTSMSAAITTGKMIKKYVETH